MRLSCLGLIMLFCGMVFPSFAQQTPKDLAPAKADPELCLSSKAPEEKVLPCTRALEASPPKERLPLLLARAKSYALLKQNEAAEKDFSAVLRIDPAHAEALFDRGTFYAHLERYPQAIADFDALLKAHPEDPDARYNRAFALAQTGADEKAIADLSAILKTHPEDAQALNDRGGLYLRSGKLEKAIADYSEALKIAKDFNEALYNRGRAYLLQGDVSQAALDFHRVLELRLYNPYAALRLALAGEEKMLQPALQKLDPELWPVPLLHYYLGDIPAKEVFDRAASLGKDAPNALAEAGYYLGARALQKGDKANAKIYFARAGASNAKRVIEYYDALFMQGKSK